MQRLFLVCVAVCVVAVSLHANDRDIAQQIKAEYHDKTPLLRHFYSGSDLHYNAQGELLGTTTVGPWTLARVAIDKVKIEQDQLRIDGRRAGELPEHEPYFPAKIIVVPGQDVHITVELPPARTEQDVRAIVARVFYKDTAEIVTDLPPYWRGYFAARGHEPKEQYTVEGDTIFILQPDVSEANFPIIYKVGGRITKPKLLHDPEPEYEPAARDAKIQGTIVLWLVVDPEGKPQNIRIMRSLGFGLDDRAAQTVRDWRFQPATRDGQPVNVGLHVEVNFRLYR
ncbi:MAG: energy transducer TonB [Terriglobales bacterium]